MKAITTFILLCSFTGSALAAKYTQQTRVELSTGQVTRGIQYQDSVSPQVRWSLAKKNSWYLHGAWRTVDVVDTADDKHQLQYGVGYIVDLNRRGALSLSMTEYNTLHASDRFENDWRDYRLRLGLLNEWAVVLGVVDNYWGTDQRSSYAEANYATTLTEHWLCNVAVGQQNSAGVTGWSMRYGHVNVAYAFDHALFGSVEYRFSNSESRQALADFAGEGWYARLGYRF